MSGINQGHLDGNSFRSGATDAGADKTKTVSTTAQNTTRPINPIELKSLILPDRNAVALACPVRTVRVDGINRARSGVIGSRRPLYSLME